MGLLNRLLRMIESARFERCLDRALKEAVWRFSKLQPHWHESLFDEAFLRRFPVRELLGMEPCELAREWTRQFSYLDERRRMRDVSQVAPVAAAFQELLRNAVDERSRRA